MDKLITLAVIAFMLFITVIAIRNYIETREWDAALKDLRIDLMTDYKPEKFLVLKAKFDKLFSKKTAYDEALYIYWKQFLDVYRKEYIDHLISEK
jgi:hypothetical protein